LIFLNQLIHRLAEELVYFAEAALGVEGGGALADVGIPLGADEGVLGIEVDGLEIGGAGLDDEFHGGPGERRGCCGDELLLGFFPGEVAGFGAGLLAGEFEGFLPMASPSIEWESFLTS
jgi:hypothetical protein